MRLKVDGVRGRLLNVRRSHDSGQVRNLNQRRGYFGGLALDERLNLLDGFYGRFVPELNQFVSTPRLIPANVTDFWRDQNLSVTTILISDDFFDCDKDVRQHSHCCFRTVKESGTVKVHVARDHVIDRKSTRLNSS